MKFIDEESKKASAQLAKEKGAFPNFKFSKHTYKIRNATTTTIAPTGSLSIIADTSSGIEPLFALKYEKSVLDGKMMVCNKLYEEALKRNKGAIPENAARLFRTAREIKPEQHVRIQAAFQKYTDNAVSKTVNLPNTATKEDVAKIFILAHQLKCKGITVYREGSRDECVMCEIK